jgi:hypothetical protein
MTQLTAPLAQASAIVVGAAAKAYTAKVTEVGQAYLRAGSMTHEWFYRGWRRTEAPALHAVTISKPDQGQEIWIDQAARTYREKHTVPTEGEVYTVAASDDVRVSFSGGSAPTFEHLCIEQSQRHLFIGRDDEHHQADSIT